MGKTYRIKLSSAVNYYYRSDKCLSEKDMAEKKRLESALCKFIHVTEVGIHDANSFVSVRIQGDYVEVKITGEEVIVEE